MGITPLTHQNNTNERLDENLAFIVIVQFKILTLNCMAKKAIKKIIKPKKNMPTRSQIRAFVFGNMFTEEKWNELLNYSNTAESWNIGWETIKKIKKKFKLTRKMLPLNLENEMISRISEDTKDVELIDYFKTKININLCFMINVLKFNHQKND